MEPGAGDGPGDGVRYVLLNGRRYDQVGDSSVPASAVGEQVGEVCFNVTDMRFEPGSIQPMSEVAWPDGDAYRVAAGTPIHAFASGDSMLRLAVLTIDGWVAFEVYDIEDAATPAQLIDLGGPFAEIVVYRWEGDVELMRVDDPVEVASLIDALRTAPSLDPPFPAGEPAFSIDLVRPDGTITRRFVDPASERLSPRIELPQSWTALLQVATNAG